ncbi:multifunctional methyltransferase subunit TRM112-like protein [Corticium candelabrum]|uniref:multifunctional methyltransferase subunit TRM112-like protein n=1 Tax=Corticium candelabrum TaxID=121492 RepID=UPI002E259108|nr:multifunctional methyltransferase subunit TRM112-like protein [Corticium candelabrum]
MRLLIHNMLMSRVKGVKKGYPFGIKATKVEEKSVDFNAEFIARIISRIEWEALEQAAESIGVSDLPKEVVPEYEKNEEFLRLAHHALMEVEVIEGCLVCPESGREFPIKDGIPNMLLNEDEV